MFPQCPRLPGDVWIAIYLMKWSSDPLLASPPPTFLRINDLFMNFLYTYDLIAIFCLYCKELPGLENTHPYGIPIYKTIRVCLQGSDLLRAFHSGSAE